jgi:hypothetical protein
MPCREPSRLRVASFSTCCSCMSRPKSHATNRLPAHRCATTSTARYALQSRAATHVQSSLGAPDAIPGAPSGARPVQQGDAAVRGQSGTAGRTARGLQGHAYADRGAPLKPKAPMISQPDRMFQRGHEARCADQGADIKRRVRASNKAARAMDAVKGAHAPGEDAYLTAFPSFRHL